MAVLMYSGGRRDGATQATFMMLALVGVSMNCWGREPVTPSDQQNAGASLTVATTDDGAGCGTIYPGRAYVHVGGLALAVGDLNGDGRPDLVANEPTGSAAPWVLANTSTGTCPSFATAVRLAQSGSNAGGDGAIHDLDGDGRPDVVLTNGNGPTVFRNTGTAGGIAFAPAVSVPGSSLARALAVGDLDLDGKADVASVTSSSNAVTMTFNRSSGPGNIAFSSAATATAGSTPRDVAVADLDGDGKPDLVVPNSAGTLSVIPNATVAGGPAAFEPRRNFAVGSTPFAVATADLDGDGRVDVIVANFGSNSISVLRNVSSGPGNFTFDTRRDFVTSAGPLVVRAEDLNNDGRPDVAALASNGQTLHLWRNMSTGPGDVGLAPRTDAAWNAGSIMVADVTADGLPELLSQGGVVTLNVSQGPDDLSFAARIDAVAGTSARAVAVGDLDGDGRADLAAADAGTGSVSVVRTVPGNLGLIGLAASASVPTGDVPSSVAAADFDGDGRLDLAVAKEFASAVRVIPNASNGPANVAWGAGFDLAVGARPLAVAAGDVDRDGRPDLVSVNFEASTVSVLRNVSPSAGAIAFAPRIDLVTDEAPLAVRLADVDSDLKLDIVVVCGVGSASVLRNFSSGPGQVSFGFRFNVATGPGVNTVAVGDLDGDARPDLVFGSGSENSVSVARNLTQPGSNLAFASRVTTAAGFGVSAIDLGDIDGDGRLDVALGAPNVPSQAVGVLINASAGPGLISFALITTYAAPGAAVVLSDLDGDRRLDLVTTHPQSGRVSVLQNQLPPPTPCPGDANGSRSVDLQDLTHTLMNFGARRNSNGVPSPLPGDANDDGVVDFSDVVAVLANFGLRCGS